MTGGTEHDWNNLIGRRTQVWKDGHLIRTGLVEDVAQAAGALWLAGHGVDGRVLFQKADGYSAKPVCEALP